MKKVFTFLALLVAGYFGYLQTEPGNPSGSVQQLQQSDQRLEQAFQNRTSDLQIAGSGRVTRVLSDDLEGSRHQRFILTLASGQSLMVAHNIDLAPRINGLREGDQVDFYGEYEWNERGGVIHWTHHDPNNRHPHGWLKHNGRTYQ